MPLHEPVADILDGDYRVMFKPFDVGSYSDHLSVAIKIYNTKKFRTQIMLWPDKNGHIPTEKGYSIRGQHSALKAMSAAEGFDVVPLQPKSQLH